MDTIGPGLAPVLAIRAERVDHPRSCFVEDLTTKAQRARSQTQRRPGDRTDLRRQPGFDSPLCVSLRALCGEVPLGLPRSNPIEDRPSALSTRPGPAGCR